MPRFPSAQGRLNHDPGFHLSCDENLSEGWGPPLGGYFERRRDRLAAWRLTLRRAAWYFRSSFSTSAFGTRAMRPSKDRNSSSG